MGGCQNYGPFLGTRNIRCLIIIRTQKGTLILTTTHVSRSRVPGLWVSRLRVHLWGLGFRGLGFRV